MKKYFLPHQKHDSHLILTDYGTDQVSVRINDKGNEIDVKPSNSFSFKSVTHFRTKFKTPIKKSNKCLQQQSLLLNDIDITSNDEEHFYSRNPIQNSTFVTDKILHEETSSIMKKTKIHWDTRHQNQHLQLMYKQTLNLYTLFTHYTLL